MKVKGTQTTVQTVDVDIDDSQIKYIVEQQSVGYLAGVLKNKLLREFIDSLSPFFRGERTIREGWLEKHRGKFVLVHIDADWDYHKNVGEDEEIRALTKEEAQKYHTLCNLDTVIADFQK